MKLIIKSTCLLVLMTVNAFGEPTPAGATPTFTTSAGNSFTYYYKNGDPVPPGTKMFLSPAGTAQLTNDQGFITDSVFPTQADAQRAREYQPDCSGAVFGPGPGGIPAGCPGSSNTSGSASAAPAVDDKAYDKASFELITLLYGASEIGAKSCTPAGAKMPGSLSSWWAAVKVYSTGEVARDKTLNENINIIQKKIQDLTGANTADKDLQTEAIQLQIELVNASIESVNGTNGRIPLREKLLVASLQSTEANGKENIKTVEAYKNMVDKSFVASLDAAKAACGRKKKVKTCVTDEDGNETCTEKEVKDPVPGCDVAMAQIPVMRSGPAQSYGETYLTTMPSTALNNKLESFETDMTNIMAAIPRSNDGNYDWSSPMEEGLKAMKLARKDSGTKCPIGDDAGGKDKISKASTNFLSSLGLDDSSISVAKTFGDVWGASDKVIGQAAYRGEYFALVGKQINAILAMDRAKLQTLLNTKTKLENYLKNIKTAIAGGATVAAKSTTTTTTTTSPSKSATGSGAAAISKNQQTEISISKNAVNAAPTSTGLQSAALVTGALTTAPKSAASGVTSSSTSAGSINSTDGLSLGSASMALAKKSIEGIAKNDKKLSGMVQTSDGSSTASSTGSSSSKTDSKSKAAKPTGTQLTVINNDSGADSLKGQIASSFKALDNDPKANEIYKSASNGYSEYSSEGRNNYSGSIRKGTRTVSETTLGYSKPPAGSKGIPMATTNLKHTAAVKTSGPVTEDGRLLSQSIVAKKFKKKDEYTTLENDSLFQRVTKAYIRNYEKVDDSPAPVEAP
ncbi:MAG: hypothetical protein H7177_00470 [Rhizobacter sp.]|nr:hypothetical protein [Bacteriovorax sp.]